MSINKNISTIGKPVIVKREKTTESEAINKYLAGSFVIFIGVVGLIMSFFLIIILIGFLTGFGSLVILALGVRIIKTAKFKEGIAICPHCSETVKIIDESAFTCARCKNRVLVSVIKE